MLDECCITTIVTNSTNALANLSLNDIATTLIALFALIFTIWQGIKQRKHDRLSVKPHLDMIEHRNQEGHQVSFSLELKNNGLGPAIIRSHKIYKGSIGSDDYELVEDLEADLKEMFDFTTVHTSELHPDFALSTNATHPYLLIKINSDDPEAASQLRTAVYCTYNVEIKFESMYAETFTFSTVPYTRGRIFLKDRSLDDLAKSSNLIV